MAVRTRDLILKIKQKNNFANPKLHKSKLEGTEEIPHKPFSGLTEDDTLSTHQTRTNLQNHISKQQDIRLIKHFEAAMPNKAEIGLFRTNKEMTVYG